MSGRRGTGCVTNFDHGDQKLTIWDTGNLYRLSEFGVLGQTLPLSNNPIFQSIAKEMHRLASEVGRLRRVEIEAGRERARLREKVEAMQGIDLRPPLAKEGYLLAVKDILTLLAEPGEASASCPKCGEDIPAEVFQEHLCYCDGSIVVDEPREESS